MKSRQYFRATVVAVALAATLFGASEASAFGGPHMGIGFGFGHGWGHGWGWGHGGGWGYGHGWGPGFGYGGGYGGDCFLKRFVTDDGDIVVRRVCY